ncbi:hypothetical protein [Nitrososphaera sp.]|uniref:hypothetical protein n=1 Tax=Nitrososphaera sp. TaxID=1971748 RepID=UPI002ED95EFB
MTKMIVEKHCTSCGHKDDVEVEVPRLAENEKAGANDVTYPTFYPQEYCRDGSCPLGGLHENKRYSVRATKACVNCDQLAPPTAPRCAFCDGEEFEDVPLELFEEKGILLPRIMERHTH